MPPQLTEREWNAVPDLAEAHGLAMLIGTRLAAEAPPAAYAGLGSLAGRTSARAARLASDRAAIRREFRRSGLQYCWLKGAWLAEAGVVDELRPSADTDVLCVAGERRASAVLCDLGYRLDGRTGRHAVYRLPGNRRVVDERGEHPDNPRPVEVHHRVTESYRGTAMNLTPLFTTKPAVGAVFLHLAAHTTVDAVSRRMRAVQLLDLAALAPRLDASDWRIVHAAARPAIARFVWPALHLAAIHAAADVPDEVMASLRAQVARSLRRWTESSDVDGLSRVGRADTPRRLLEMPRYWPLDASERWRMWRTILLPPRGEIADRDPGAAAGSHWPVLYARHVPYVLRVAVRRMRRRG